MRGFHVCMLVHEFLEARGSHRMDLCHAPLCFLRQGLSLNLELTDLLGLMAGELWGSICLCPLSTRVTGELALGRDEEANSGSHV